VYLFTATLTELGRTEKWFWKATPKKIIAMLDEKKRIDIMNWKIQAALINGATIELDGEKEKEMIPGLDCPAGEGATDWMTGG
jgi:hypothetical protein